MRNLVFLSLLLASGCKARDGDLIALVLQRTGQKIETATGATPNQFAGRLRSNASPYGLADRVQSRLNWDRYVEGTRVDVTNPSAGVVKVTGIAPDLAKKQRIVDLARSTTGVKDVIDEMKLPPEK